MNDLRNAAEQAWYLTGVADGRTAVSEGFRPRPGLGAGSLGAVANDAGFYPLGFCNRAERSAYCEGWFMGAQSALGRIET